MKIRPVGAQLFHGDGQTDMTNLTVTFRNFANAPQHDCINNYSVHNNIILYAANTAENTQLYIQILVLCRTDLLGQSQYGRIFLYLPSCLYLLCIRQF